MPAVGLPLSHDSPVSVGWSTCRLSIKAVVDSDRHHCSVGYGVTWLFSPAVKGLKEDRGQFIHYFSNNDFEKHLVEPVAKTYGI